MLKYVDTKVTFSEVPDEISLCINISNCPHRCRGCHSPYLQEDIGGLLSEETLSAFIEHNKGITCVCFMGGDNDIPQLVTLANMVHKKYNLRTAWYSGLQWHPSQIDRPSCMAFDYIKTGPYSEKDGPLTSRTTNQRMYAKGSVLPKMDASSHMFYDITDKFWKDDTDNEKTGVDS